MTSHGARVTPPASRRQSASVSTPPPLNSIARGATARSAVNSRVSSTLSAPARRGSINKIAPPPAINGESRESLAANLKHETEQKEQLLVQVQTKEQTITTLTKENSNLSSALNAAETRLSELYTEQARMEEDLSARIEVVDKLRSQVRELEREKRDLHRRYNEQTSTFDAERQAFYDNEQHLKSRIQSLMQARKEPPVPKSPSIIIDSESEAEMEDEDEPSQPNTPSQKNQDLPSESEPAEMTSVRLELSTLSTSYGSLQSTLLLLQTQLVDLKRVNNQLQEENESYNILLREKTLSGQYDLMKQVGGGSVSSSEQGDDEDDTDGDVGSMKSPSRPRSVLDTVHEHTEEVLDPDYAKAGERQEEKAESEDPDRDALASPRSARHPRHGRRRTTSTASRSPSARGESLADLPITGPGLDLAAELGRAENKDVLEGRTVDDRDHSVLGKGGKRGKKGSSESNRKISYSSDVGGLDPSASLNDVESMRTEIKSLKDANKALSLYASKIIDRIISQEGFEHVLAVDYDKLPPTPSTATGPGSATLGAPSVSQKVQRRATMFSRSTSNPAPPSPQPERLTTFDSPPLNNNSSNLNPPISRQRRSLSFDWRGFSVFGGDKKADTTNLRPLTLKAGAPTVTGARKLETQEDEEDRRERERLNATMKLMGIDKPPVPAPAMQKSFSMPTSSANSPLPTSTNTGRFSFFRSKSTTGSDAGSTKSAPATHDSPTTLTQEALVQAEAENSLAALDAQERALSAELAKGLSGGFTEIGPRRKSGSRRSRTSGGGSGSTVWSAGMAHGEDDGES
ncbi:hypothetical protein EWM64_g231 [Hericium alpestre]|uniref:Uncharacterized protein n=1 Tax=Hericium alpestre TaxID=135208 RepID=A0A4Z0AB19_9AGAM|nr:hypothetical protein EWM64_g231 [Hericium alpestre]